MKLEWNKDLSMEKVDKTDFSDYNIRHDINLAGVTTKIVVEDKNLQKFMLKFGKSDGTRDYLTEYISCKIAKELGYPVQEVELGTFRGQECVSVKMFDTQPITFEDLGYSSTDGYPLDSRKSNYNLDWILDLKSNYKFELTKEQYNTWVYEVFVLDMLIGNFDRHENNWGFVFNNEGKYIPSPLYDLGASLYPKYIDNIPKNVSISHMLEFETRCGIKYKNKKRNYFIILEDLCKIDEFKEILRDIVKEFKEISLDDIWKNITEFNHKYDKFIVFTEKCLNERINLIENKFLKET